MVSLRTVHIPNLVQVINRELLQRIALPVVVFLLHDDELSFDPRRLCNQIQPTSGFAARS